MYICLTSASGVDRDSDKVEKTQLKTVKEGGKHRNKSYVLWLLRMTKYSNVRKEVVINEEIII